MVAYLILASVVFVSGASAGSLLVVIIGIHRGDHGKRLTGPAASNSEMLARRLLTGSRGYDLPDDTGEDQDYRPFRRSQFRPALRRIRLQEVPHPIPVDATQGVAIPQVR